MQVIATEASDAEGSVFKTAHVSDRDGSSARKRKLIQGDGDDSDNEDSSSF